MIWFAAPFFFLVLAMAQEPPARTQGRFLAFPVSDGGSETRVGGSKFQLQYQWPEDAEPPSDPCRAKYSSNVAFDVGPDQILGSFEGRDFEGGYLQLQLFCRARIHG